MALQIPLTITQPLDPEQPDLGSTEVVYPESYARIIVIRAHVPVSYLVVGWYADKASREQDGPILTMREFVVPTNNLTGDLYTAAYNYLKTLPEFEGAQDC